MSKKILFLINTLRDGGAENVLVTLLNHLDPQKYDIELKLITRKGPFIERLAPHIRLTWITRENSKIWGRIVYFLLPRLSSVILHRLFVHKKYDVEVAFLEGYATKIIAGASRKTKKIAWVHVNLVIEDWIAPVFSTVLQHINCYRSFSQIVCVSQDVKDAFISKFGDMETLCVKYNPIDSEKIRQLALEDIAKPKQNIFRMVSVGRFVPQKNFLRLLKCVKKMRDEGLVFELILIGEGPERSLFEKYIAENSLSDCVLLTGFCKNPYPWIKSADLFVCSSNTEGFSTAVSEAVILGVPVLTTGCTGMNEILCNGKYGIITNNNDEALCKKLREVLQEPSKLVSFCSGEKSSDSSFCLEQRIKKIEEFFE